MEFALGEVSETCGVNVGDTCDNFMCLYGYWEEETVTPFECTESGSWSYNLSSLCTGECHPVHSCTWVYYRWYVLALLAHLSWRLTRWAYRMGLEPASVRPCVRPSVRASTFSNMNISETSKPITIKFYLKHHWGGGKAALGFGADHVRTLVSMATDSSHRVIMGKRASSRFLGYFWSDPFYTCR